MKRRYHLGVALTVALLAAACGEAPTSTDLRTDSTAAAVVPGTCTNLTELNQLAAVLFTPTSSPNINSVRGKLRNLDGLVRRGKFADAEAHAGEIVAFTLKKHNQGGLAGTADDVEAFSDKVLCFAGIDIDVEEPTNSYFILPSDTAQVITNIGGTAGIAFPANPVAEPTLVAFALIPDTYPEPGAGPLSTKLDQYPGFIQITKTSETNAALTAPVVVGVCAQGPIPADVRARLRLGHEASFGFELTPAASANFLSCPVQTAAAPASSPWDRFVNLVLPRQAHAFQSQEFGGGVGGTVTEFSPFAPVDPQLEFGGGVGGTVTEFIRQGALRLDATTPTTAGGIAKLATSSGTCPVVEGAFGSPLRDDCRPFITLTTRLGTPFIGVPVQWEVTQGGGAVAPNTGACGTFGATAATTTGVNGGAGICWTLGAVGANQVRALPGLGGDAIAGVTFAPAVLTFDATANPPAGLRWTQQPPSIVPTYPPLAAEITVVDKNGERVFAGRQRVIVRLNQGTFHLGATELVLKSDLGIATVSAIVPTPGTGYTLIATAPDISPVFAPAVSSMFEVVPGEPFAVVPVAGNGVSAPAGSVIEARVRLVDRVGTPIPGAAIAWSVDLSGPGAVTPPSSVTDAAGEATASWTLGLGTNYIRAASPNPIVRTRLTSTGTAP